MLNLKYYDAAKDMRQPNPKASYYADYNAMLDLGFDNAPNVVYDEIEYEQTYGENDFAKIEFADDGPGVDKDNLDKLFEVFYRTDKARSNTSNGSGIGLAFVKKAVLAMGGKVEASENKYGGLSIIIYLRCENE